MCEARSDFSMNEYNRLCLCDREHCPFCRAWRDEQKQNKQEVLRTKFKDKK
jgi:hypothetical protein